MWGAATVPPRPVTHVRGGVLLRHVVHLPGSDEDRLVKVDLGDGARALPVDVHLLLVHLLSQRVPAQCHGDLALVLVAGPVQTDARDVHVL